MNQKWYLAQMVLLIWNPAIWSQLPECRRRRRLQLEYRTRGIVLHDRALNGQLGEAPQ